jgi:hypothetical protein
VRCVKLGPRSGSLTMTADTQPGMVNSGCPGSKSKHKTCPNTGRLRLTRNRRKVDFPTPFPPHTTVQAGSRHTEEKSTKLHLISKYWKNVLCVLDYLYYHLSLLMCFLLSWNISFLTIIWTVHTLSSQPSINRWESDSEMTTVVWISTENGQNTGYKKGTRSNILRKAHGTTQNKMVQPSTRRHQADRKQPAK